MRRAPTPRQEIYDLYWVFAARRQSLFEQRLKGLPPPWTDDPILQRFKFCNVFRASDRVSQYLIRHIAYPRVEQKPEDKLFQIAAFRTFSKPATWDSLCRILGCAPTLDHLENGAFESALDVVRAQNGGLYTGAFILCANKAYGFDLKHQNHVALFKDMFLTHKAAKQMRGANALEQVVSFLQSFPLMGPFMAYQTAIDLNYSDLLNFSENDYTQAGPGALRGIKKCFVDTGDASPQDIILQMVARQEDEFSRLGLPFHGLFGRRLHAIDCQGLFCEVDKYCREAAPELKSARQRIKTRFTPTPEPLPLFFPPKWGLLSACS